MQAQQALIAETNFRRAMENSMLTGMRALDMHGRITYVNAAFCQMTGLERGRTGGPHSALSLLARGRPRTAGGAAGGRTARAAPCKAASRCA
jgi:PAS domain-containing protein